MKEEMETSWALPRGRLPREQMLQNVKKTVLQLICIVLNAERNVVIVCVL